MNGEQWKNRLTQRRGGAEVEFLTPRLCVSARESRLSPRTVPVVRSAKRNRIWPLTAARTIPPCRSPHGVPSLRPDETMHVVTLRYRVSSVKIMVPK